MTLPLSQFDLVECKIPPSLSQILIKSSSPDIFTPRQNCYAKTLHCPPYRLRSIFIQPALPPPFHAERVIAFKEPLFGWPFVNFHGKGSEAFFHGSQGRLASLESLCKRKNFAYLCIFVPECGVLRHIGNWVNTYAQIYLESRPF